MKQIKLRIEVTAEDGVTVETAKTALRKILEDAGVQHVGQSGDGDLGGDQPGARVFWMTCAVLRGNDGAEPVVAKRQRASK